MIKIIQIMVRRAAKRMDDLFFENDLEGMLGLFVAEKRERSFAQSAPNIETKNEAFKRAPVFWLTSPTHGLPCPKFASESLVMCQASCLRSKKRMQPEDV